MEKHFELSGRLGDGRPLIHLVEPGTGYGLGSSGDLEKTASGEHLPEVIELVESIAPQPDRLYVVNSALGAGEWVGFNLRGDWFTEEGLLHEPHGWRGIPVWDVQRRREAAAETELVTPWGALAWGYPTFYNAHRFRHHQNKDPHRAYGYVLGAFWDARMHRVILVSELIRASCERLGALDIYERIARGEFPDTSMGAKVPMDICSICGHVATEPRFYCEHVRKDAPSPYGMRALLPDGRRCGVYNTHPRFFDDSFVFIGAERSAKVMSNVTDMVRGKNTYNDRLFSPGPRRSMERVASMTPVTGSPIGTFEPGVTSGADSKYDRAEALGRAVGELGAPSRVRGPTEATFASKLPQILSDVAVLDEQERLALEYAKTHRTRAAAVADKTLGDLDRQTLESTDVKALLQAGVHREQVDRALAIVRDREKKAGLPKLATSAKWATMLKEIPAPSEYQTALLRDHEARLVPVLPKSVLDMSSSEDSLRDLLSGLFEHGVVLRKPEFQYCALRAMGQAPLADRYSREGVVFSPTPLDEERDPSWRPGRSSLTEILARVLGTLLERRSFAPQSVMIRIMNAPPLEKAAQCSHVRSDPTLNRVSQRYNDYRTGLILASPGEKAASTGGTKLADVANTLSGLLVRLAYWHDDHLG